MTTFILADGDPLRRAAVAETLAPLGAECCQVASGWDLIGEMKVVNDADVVVVAHVGSLYPDPCDIVVLSRLAGCSSPFLLYGGDILDRLVLTTHYAPVAVAGELAEIRPMVEDLADAGMSEAAMRD